MIPISLKLKGIYSYQNNEQFIDFTQLCDSGLFGIFGPVGSGKSTILEAISFALYGETERLNKRENRTYNMMNLKSDNLLIDFIFKSGKDNNEYRFIVKGKRNSKRFDDVKSYEREAYKRNNAEWLAISADAAEEITSLSYTNFRRTIIIPQGRFQEFLQLGDTDRTKMMKELFQLERFDLYDKTKLLETRNLTQKTKLEGQLQQLEDISTEKINEIALALQVLKTEMEKNQELFKEKEKSHSKLKELKELFEQIKIKEDELSQLSHQKTTVEILKSKLKEYQDCLINFKSKIDRVVEEKERLKRTNEELQLFQNQHKTIVTQLEKLEKEFQILKIEYDKKEELDKAVKEYEKMLNIKQLNDETDVLKSRIEKGNLTIKDCISTIENLEQEQTTIKSRTAQLKENQTDIIELAKIKEWFVKLETLEKDLKINETLLKENSEKKEKKQEEIIQLLEKNGLKGNRTDLTEIQKQIEQVISEYETRQEVLEEEIKHMKIKQGLSRYSEMLKEGEACPVCGSKHHPQKMSGKNLLAKTENLEKELQIHKNEVKRINDTEKAFNVKNTEYRTIESSYSELSKKIEAMVSEINQHNESYSFEKIYIKEEIEKEFESAQKQKKEISDFEEKLDELNKKLAKEIKNKEKYQEAVNLLNNELASKNASSKTLLNQIEVVDIEKSLELSDSELKSKTNDLKLKYKEIVEKFEKVDREIAKLKPEKDKLQGIIETKLFDLKRLSAGLGKIEEELLKSIQESKYQTPENVQIILNQKLDIEKENKLIRDFENKLFSLGEQLKKLKKETENKEFSQEEFINSENELEKLKSIITEHNKQLGSLEKDKTDKETKLIEKNKLNEQFEQLKLRSENIQTLKNLFKASGFVNYVSSVYLQNLVNAANERFAVLTGQKLRLELTETNDFVIRDYLNQGKTRSVKTLSGGQTFQASLSLALALADNIQSVTKSKHNFFFLDEGFGSLDKDSLAIVFQSLKSLQKENRVVGVISHVEELQMEIGSYLKIENDPEKGSRILKSWE